MLFLSGFEPYSRWVPLLSSVLSVTVRTVKIKQLKRRRQSANLSPEQMNLRSFKL